MKKNKKMLIFLIAMLAILIVSTIILLILIYESSSDLLYSTGKKNTSRALKGVIVKLSEDSLGFMTEDGEPFYVIYNGLGSLGDSEKFDVELKEGQHVLVTYSGHILKTEPKTIPDVGGIFILKEESDIEIPDNIYVLFQDYYTVN